MHILFQSLSLRLSVAAFAIAAAMSSVPIAAEQSPPVPAIAMTLPTIVPTQVHLTPAEPSGTLRLTNEKSVATRFELKTFTWAMQADGELILNPTDAIRLSTAGFNLPPGETVEVRVDAQPAPSGGIEQTFRIGVSEIHDDTPQETAGLEAIAAITLPVFLRPQGAQANGRIEGSRLDQGKLSIAVSNHGQAHMFVKSITLRGLDAMGGTVFEVERNGWYVLAGDRRDYQAVVAGKDCRRTRRLILEAGLLDGGTFSQFIEITGKQCGSAERTQFSLRASQL
jgi:P pilus assembly chaperone PapD